MNPLWPPFQGRKFRVHDPRLGQDYSIHLRRGGGFSTLQAGLLAVEFCPELPESKVNVPPSLCVKSLNELLTRSLVTFGGLGFQTVYPVTRETQEYCQAHKGPKGQLEHINDSFIEYFEISNPTAERIFNLRRHCASYAEWVVGSCKTRFTQSPTAKGFWTPERSFETWDFYYLLRQVDNLYSLSFFDGENGELIFLTRPFEALDSHLDAVRSALGGGQVEQSEG